MRRPGSEARVRLNPEKVAYWYLRLNGFFQIENFYVHPSGKGGARTDADLLAVRFPQRAERLFDDADDIMEDDVARLNLSDQWIDVVIAEVKSGRCALNGPWTNPENKNVHRVLAAIGCLPHQLIDSAADALYRSGIYEGDLHIRIRLIAVGRKRSPELEQSYPHVEQVVWSDLLEFLYTRHQEYKNQKKQTDHWDKTGKDLKRMATARQTNCAKFVTQAISCMGFQV